MRPKTYQDLLSGECKENSDISDMEDVECDVVDSDDSNADPTFQYHSLDNGSEENSLLPSDEETQLTVSEDNKELYNNDNNERQSTIKRKKKSVYLKEKLKKANYASQESDSEIEIESDLDEDERCCNSSYLHEV